MFKDQRLIVAVTSLDIYDDSNDPGLESIITTLKSAIVNQFEAIGYQISEDCVVPLCAKGALEARLVLNGEFEEGRALRKVQRDLEDLAGVQENLQEFIKVCQMDLLESKYAIT